MKMTQAALESGYWRAYRDFYRWGSIFKSTSAKEGLMGRLRHLAYTGGWKKFEPFWDWVIKAKRVHSFVPLLEVVLAGLRNHGSQETYSKLQKAERVFATRESDPRKLN